MTLGDWRVGKEKWCPGNKQIREVIVVFWHTSIMFSLTGSQTHSIFFTLTESSDSHLVTLFRLIQSLLGRESLKTIHWAIVRIIQAIWQIKLFRFAPPWTLIGQGRSSCLRHSFVMWYEMSQWFLRKYTGGSVVSLTQPPVSWIQASPGHERGQEVAHS